MVGVGGEGALQGTYQGPSPLRFFLSLPLSLPLFPSHKQREGGRERLSHKHKHIIAPLRLSIWQTARSVEGSVPMTEAVKRRPSVRVTWTLSEVPTTCAFDSR